MVPLGLAVLRVRCGTLSGVSGGPRPLGNGRERPLAVEGRVGNAYRAINRVDAGQLAWWRATNGAAGFGWLHPLAQRWSAVSGSVCAGPEAAFQLHAWDHAVGDAPRAVVRT